MILAFKALIVAINFFRILELSTCKWRKLFEKSDTYIQLHLVSCLEVAKEMYKSRLFINISLTNDGTTYSAKMHSFIISYYKKIYQRRSEHRFME